MYIMLNYIMNDQIPVSSVVHLTKVVTGKKYPFVNATLFIKRF